MNRYDAMVGMGVGMIGVGLWFIYPPAALLAVGTALILAGVAGAWSEARKRSGE